MMRSPSTSMSGISSPSRGAANLPYYSSSALSDFEIERVPKQNPPPTRRVRQPDSEAEEEYMLRDSVARLLAAKTRPFAVSGRIPFDPANLVLFFRSKSGITHSLDFPIDIDYDTPPALDVLIAACRPELDEFQNGEALFYPPNFPLTATLELANHPILDAIRTTLFPSLPTGQYLIATRDRLQVVGNGSSMPRRAPAVRNDGRLATISVILPIRFRGGALVINDVEGNVEKFYGRGGKGGDMEWTAYLAECDYEIEPVQKGCRVSLSFGVYLRTFGLSGPNPYPLISPSDNFLDHLSPILNLSRGRKIAFYLVNEYGVNPAEVLAESLVPHLKGGDSLLYHAMKLYKLNPELHWTAGGYIWPATQTVEVADEIPGGDPSRSNFSPAVRGTFSAYGGSERDEVDLLRSRVEQSGAIPLSEAEIFILSNWDSTGVIGKERVPFVSGGEMEKLVVNMLLVAFVA